MTAEELKQARLDAGLTQTEAAALIGRSLRCWAHWEGGTRQINAGLVELFLIKIKRENQTV